MDLDDEELEATKRLNGTSKKEKNIIVKIDKILHRLGSINIYGNTYNEAQRRYCQREINKVYDELWELKKELKGADNINE